MSTTTSLFIFATLLLLLSKTPALSPSAATYYFIGAVLRQCHIGFDRIFRPSPVALLLWINLLGLEEWYDWGTLAIVFSCWCCISSLMWIHSLINRLQDNANVRKTEDTLLYIGRNTLPIYLFHPILRWQPSFIIPSLVGTGAKSVSPSLPFHRYSRKHRHRQDDGEDPSGLSLRKRKDAEINNTTIYLVIWRF